jgi:hypothetical protein
MAQAFPSIAYSVADRVTVDHEAFGVDYRQVANASA